MALCASAPLERAVKRLLKRLLRPFLAPFNARYASKKSFNNVAGETQRIAKQLAVLEAHVPELLGVIGSQNAALRALQRAEGPGGAKIAELAERIEFVRREIMFELRYGSGGDLATTERPKLEPQILDPEAVARLPEIRLNVGCGHLPLEGFLNVDMRRLDGVDIIASATDLPFDPDTVDQIHSAHLLEHFPQEELTRSVLPHWFERLKPGGILSAVVPDALTMLSEYANGRFSFDDLKLVTFGEQEYEGDFHFTMFSPESIVRLLEDAGFEDAKVGETGRRNGVCYEMDIRARKPLFSSAEDRPRS